MPTKSKTPDRQVHLTIGGELADKLQQLVEKLDEPWRSVSLADAVRYALMKGVDVALNEDADDDDGEEADEEEG